MLLGRIAKEVQPLAILGKQDVNIREIVNNSNCVREGSLFICIKGFTGDGHLYLHDAVARGAVAAIVEDAQNVTIPQLVVGNSRLAQALACQFFYGYPSKNFTLIGITGTNGKTTISYLTEAILREAGLKTGLIGSIKYQVGSLELAARHTTPDALELNAIMQQMTVERVEAVVMEVSSHALELHRVTGCDFDITVFSNLTRDHFEFHHNFHNYLQAKLKLFANQRTWGEKHPAQRYAIINRDDPHYRDVLKAAQAANVFTYGRHPEAYIRAVEFQLMPYGSQVKIKAGKHSFEIQLPLPGLYNIYNALAAVGIGLVMGIEPPLIQKALRHFTRVPGRCEFIDCGQTFTVVVDFAHNPQAIKNILSLPLQQKGKKIIVFGCEGGKDPGKRSLMGRIAAQNADYCIITTDNIYAENPLDIARQIEDGLIRGGMNTSQYQIILNRYEAIRSALEMAQSEDVVIIAGKGHENRQILYDQAFPFDDAKVVQTLLKRL